MVISALTQEHAGPKFTSVHFGNMLGSSGSVFPKFNEQITSDGPVTVTRPEIVDHFMPAPEPVWLMLQGAPTSDSGHALLLDMCGPVKGEQLARDLVWLAGHTTEEFQTESMELRPGSSCMWGCRRSAGTRW